MTVSLSFFAYLFVMAGVTYLIRMIPLQIFKEKIKNRFVLSFLYYIPYAVLSAMIVPAVFYETGSFISAAVGFAVSAIVAFFGKSLPTVAACSCLSVLACEIVRQYIL